MHIFAVAFCRIVHDTGKVDLPPHLECKERVFCVLQTIVVVSLWCLPNIFYILKAYVTAC